MRKKKTLVTTNDEPANAKLPGIDLDPIDNDQLYDDVWNQLCKRLKITPSDGSVL
jgi:hypothetical protein